MLTQGKRKCLKSIIDVSSLNELEQQQNEPQTSRNQCNCKQGNEKLALIDNFEKALSKTEKEKEKTQITNDRNTKGVTSSGLQTPGG